MVALVAASDHLDENVAAKAEEALEATTSAHICDRSPRSRSLFITNQG